MLSPAPGPAHRLPGPAGHLGRSVPPPPSVLLSARRPGSERGHSVPQSLDTVRASSPALPAASYAPRRVAPHRPPPQKWGRAASLRNLLSQALEFGELGCFALSFCVSWGRGRAECRLSGTNPRWPRTADGLSKGMPDSGVEGAGAGPPSRSRAYTSTARLSFTKGRHTVRVGWVWFGWGQGFVVRLSPDTPNPWSP